VSKPWNAQTFPKDRVVYVRMKGHPVGGSLISTIHPDGVNVLICDDQGKMVGKGFTWWDLHRKCEQVDGSPCGVKR